MIPSFTTIELLSHLCFSRHRWLKIVKDTQSCGEIHFTRRVHLHPISQLLRIRIEFKVPLWLKFTFHLQLIHFFICRINFPWQALLTWPWDSTFGAAFPGLCMMLSPLGSHRPSSFFSLVCLLQLEQRWLWSTLAASRLCHESTSSSPPLPIFSVPLCDRSHPAKTGRSLQWHFLQIESGTGSNHDRAVPTANYECCRLLLRYLMAFFHKIILP